MKNAEKTRKIYARLGLFMPCKCAGYDNRGNMRARNAVYCKQRLRTGTNSKRRHDRGKAICNQDWIAYAFNGDNRTYRRTYHDEILVGCKPKIQLPT